MSTDQNLWKVLKNIQLTLKKWEHVKERLPVELRDDANEALHTELVEATENLQGFISDALSHEVRANTTEADLTILEENISDIAHRFIMAEQIDVAKELLGSLVQLQEASKEELVTQPSVNITEEQVAVVAKLIEIGEDSAAKKLATQLVESRTPEVALDTSEMGSKRAEFELNKGKTASGVDSLQSLIEDVVWGNQFEREASRWLNANFDEPKQREMKEEIVASVTDILSKYLQ